MKTHCVRGHELTEETTYQRYTAEGIKDGRKCRVCHNAESRRSSVKHPDTAYRSRIVNQMRHRYGIGSLEKRDAILASQGGGCAICGRTDCHWGKGFMNVWHIDHDPAKPGTYRGVLCGFCNTALGRLESNIDKVLAYLGKS